MLEITELIKTIKESKQKTRAYDTEAVVRRIEGNTAWVHIPGGVDETPVRMTVKAKEGDTVQVRVSGGSAFLVGNATAPPSDDSVAVHVAHNLSITDKVLSSVKAVAEKTAKIAGNTNQYFWVKKTGSDTGAHITEVPQEEFEADPSNGGGNLLARSNGIAIRDGQTELATFSSTEVEIGKNSKTSAISFCNSLVKLVVSILDSNTFSQGYLKIQDTYDPTHQETRQSAIGLSANNKLADNSVNKTAWIQAYASAYIGVSQINIEADYNQISGNTFLIDGSYSGRIVGQNMTGSWTEPTVYSSAVTFPASGAGGYYTEGRRVYVQLRCVLAAQLNADTARQLFSGMPVPKDVEEVALCINVRSRHGASCFVDSNGALKIVADPDHAISANQNITITGVYTI